MVEMKSAIEKLTERVVMLEGEKEAVARRVNQVEERAKKVKENLEGVEREMINGMGKAKDEAKREMKDEMKKDEERSVHIVIYGMEESKKEEANERIAEDVKKVGELAEVMEVELKGEVVVKYRLGRKREEGAKTRPLKVMIGDDETRARLMNYSAELSRVEGWKRVFVAPDLTDEEREEDRKQEKERKEEAARRTEAAKEEGRQKKSIVVGKRGKRRIIKIDDRD